MNESTKKNLLRKSYYVDEVHLLKERPLFSWIDINLTELCNRKCIFCPRVDEAIYPNQRLHITEKLIQKILDELKTEKKTKQDVLTFIEEIEKYLHQQKKMQNLRKVIEIKDYIKDQGASVKQLLEYISVTF